MAWGLASGERRGAEGLDLQAAGRDEIRTRGSPLSKLEAGSARPEARAKEGARARLWGHTDRKEARLKAGAKEGARARLWGHTDRKEARLKAGAKEGARAPSGQHSQPRDLASAE
jgi:predicted Zn-dependent protease